MNIPSYPQSLIFPNSKITIAYDNVTHPNHTIDTIVIEGNRNGFLSLANGIHVFQSYLYQKIEFSAFSFVESEITFTIVEDNEVYFENGVVLKEISESYYWKLSESNIFSIAGIIHSLGYANNELHLDSGLGPNDISVYCIVL